MRHGDIDAPRRSDLGIETGEDSASSRETERWHRRAVRESDGSIENNEKAKEKHAQPEMKHISPSISMLRRTRPGMSIFSENI